VHNTSSKIIAALRDSNAF